MGIEDSVFSIWAFHHEHLVGQAYIFPGYLETIIVCLYYLVLFQDKDTVDRYGLNFAFCLLVFIVDYSLTEGVVFEELD